MTQETYNKAIEIYSIANKTNEVLLCNLNEKDFIKFYEDKKILNLCDIENANIHTKGNVSSYILSDEKYINEILKSK